MMTWYVVGIWLGIAQLALACMPPTARPPTPTATATVAPKASPTPPPTVALIRFENDDLTFTYPANFQTLAEIFPGYRFGGRYRDMGVNEVIALGDPLTAGPGTKYDIAVTLARKPLSPGATLESAARESYAAPTTQVRDFVFSACEGMADCYDARYARTWGTPWWWTHDVWSAHGGYAYVLSYGSASSSMFAHYDVMFASIVASLRFK
ncbi:MAG: hypothetical protein HZB53_16355 [Chloroflexi bacterium]|nr:hypothetical protein [Chloroflexota bacterium]